MSSSRREPCLEPASVVAVSIYSLLLAGVLIAHVMDFPTFSTESRAKSLITAEEPLLGNGPRARAHSEVLIAFVLTWCGLVVAAIVAASTRRFQGWDMYLAIAAVLVGLAILFAIALLP